MFISEKIAYIELHKTGCTHVRNALSCLMEGHLVGKHNQAPSTLFNGRKFIGSVRNPWEWYNSLWAYGCDHRGAIFSEVTKSKKFKLKGLGWRKTPTNAVKGLFADLTRRPDQWMRTYRDVNDAAAFRDWLHMMHDKDYIHDLGEGFSQSPLSKFAGLLSYRYTKLFCCKADQADPTNSLTTLNQLIDFEKNKCFIDHFILNERLEENLVDSLGHCGVIIGESDKARCLSRPRTNTSSRKNKPAYYYDGNTIQLVQERDALIIKKFKYSPPTIGK